MKETNNKSKCNTGGIENKYCLQDKKLVYNTENLYPTASKMYQDSPTIEQEKSFQVSWKEIDKW